MLLLLSLGLLSPSVAALGWEASQFCVAAAELCGGRGTDAPTTTSTPSPLPNSAHISDRQLDASPRHIIKPLEARDPNSIIQRQPSKLVQLKETLQRKLDMKKSLMRAFAQSLEKVSGAEERTGTADFLSTPTIPTITFPPDKRRRRMNNQCWKKTTEQKGILSSKIVSLSYERNMTVPEAKAKCLTISECNAMRYQRAGKFAHFLRIETRTPLLRLMLAYPHQEGWIYTC